MKKIDRDELLMAYPQTFEDGRGTIWISAEAASAADWTYEHGDAFLGDILGWGWDDAVANRALCVRQSARRAFWKCHPLLYRAKRFAWTRWNFFTMFCGIVWRDWYGRISWSMAWKMSSDLWLEGR